MNHKQQLLSIHGNPVLFHFPCVMGILNVTPDSFHRSSRITETDDVVKKAEQMIDEGASILDLGAVSTRPGAKVPSQEEELKRLIPSLQRLRHSFSDTIISIDTFRSEVARIAVQEGASMINDISGGMMDEQMLGTVAKLKVPYILMHMQGNPQTMQINPTYHDTVNDINLFFAKQIAIAQQTGIHDIIIDPGFGFGKTIDQNFELLAKLDLFQIHGRPILVGISRKSMIYKTLHTVSEDALNGTTCLNSFALMKQVHILRVHDVKEAVEVIALFNKLK